MDNRPEGGLTDGDSTAPQLHEGATMIVRHPHETSYTVVHNQTLTDTRLSWKARGLLAYLLSKPDNWTVIVASLVKEAPDGRAAVLTALGELEANGYLIRRGMARGDDGRFDGPDCEIREEPEGGWPASGKTASRLSDRGKPASGESPTSKDPLQQRKKETSTEETNAVGDLRGWSEFWSIYPKRNGRKLTKPEAMKAWAKLTMEQRRAAYRATQAYAIACNAGQTLAKDAVRFLKPDIWGEWLAPADPHATNGNGRRHDAQAAARQNIAEEIRRELAQ